MFARIESLDEFRAKVAHKEEIREMDIGHGVVSFCYMIAAENTFDDAWSREARGICFHKGNGEVVGRPLHKFFNVNERESTRVENVGWNRAHRVMDKRDGSMIHTVWTVDGVLFKSKKSFESDVALMASKWVHEQEGLKVWRLSSHVVSRNATAIFEWTAPDARIVLPYSTAELRLLHVRDNISGAYWPLDALEVVAKEFDVGLVDEYPLGLSNAEMPELAKATENVEGWVVQFDDGEMVKLKTEWYLKRHRAMTFLRERDIAQLVLDEGLDDLKSLLVGDGVDIQPILAVEARVLHDLRQLALAVDLAIAEDLALDRKSFALKHKDTEYFGLKMTKYLGKEPDFKEYFERHLLRENYSLRQIALLDSVAEAE